MRAAFASLDRLVELVEEHGGRVRASEAAAFLFALRRPPEGLARSLLGPLVAGDDRLSWRGAFVALASVADPELAATTFVVFDLETTGLSHRDSAICEIGAVRIRSLELELEASFATLVAPGVPLPPTITRITGLHDEELAGAPQAHEAVAAFSAFAGDAVLVAHNARFDVGFVNRELERASGRRLAGPVIDTVALARCLLAGRVERTSLAALAFFFGVPTEPCHRALPDAQATAEVLLRLLELAAERGVTTLAALEELAAPRARRIHAKRGLVHAAPRAPGVYLFRDSDDQVLYVGKARDLRVRLRSYFQTSRQRAPVEAALDAVARIEWRPTGSELAAALAEVELIRALRPPANARTPRPERYVYLHRQGARVVLSAAPSRYGPLRSPQRAKRAARSLRGCSEDEFEALLDGGPIPRLRHRLSRLSLEGHELELRRVRGDLEALERVLDELAQLERLRALVASVVAPALEPGQVELYLVGAGRVERRRVAEARAAQVAAAFDAAGLDLDAPIEADRLDALLVVDGYLARPSSELRVVALSGGRLAA